VTPLAPTDATSVADFRTFYGIGSDVRMLGPYSGQLSNGGERASLLAPLVEPGQPTQMIVVDEIDYLDAAPWPTEADGDGSSLHRIAPLAPGNQPSSWVALTPTPGSTSYAPVVAGDFNSDGKADGADLLAWQRGFGLALGAVRADGDADADGDVDAVDLAVWEAAWASQTSSTATPVSASVQAPADQPLAALDVARLFDAAHGERSTRRSSRIIVRRDWQTDEVQRTRFMPAGWQDESDEATDASLDAGDLPLL
ncbi:MAG: hypothetical protein KDA61_17605, partial [Planctomycetales bacterium]|nr:hypothetical protein [Planctomycetales bacterium]